MTALDSSVVVFALRCGQGLPNGARADGAWMETPGTELLLTVLDEWEGRSAWSGRFCVKFGARTRYRRCSQPSGYIPGHVYHRHCRHYNGDRVGRPRLGADSATRFRTLASEIRSHGRNRARQTEAEQKDGHRGGQPRKSYSQPASRHRRGDTPISASWRRAVARDIAGRGAQPLTDGESTTAASKRTSPIVAGERSECTASGRSSHPGTPAWRRRPRPPAR